MVKAAVEALKAYPVVNASIDGDNIVYKKDINLGIAVALDWGLIVPVVKHADDMSLSGIAKTVTDLAERARGKRLTRSEEHTSELQSRLHLVCRLLLEKKTQPRPTAPH